MTTTQPGPTQAHQHLAMFLGTWRAIGVAYGAESPGPDGTQTFLVWAGTEVYEWFSDS